MSTPINYSHPEQSGYFEHLLSISLDSPQRNKNFKVALAIAIWTTLGAIWLPGMGIFGSAVDLIQVEEKQPPQRVQIAVKPDKVVKKKPLQRSRAKKIPHPESLMEMPQPNLEMVSLETPELFENTFTALPADVPESPPIPKETVYAPDTTGIEPPIITKKVPPRYPRRAINFRIQGHVILEAILGKDGTIRDIRVVKGLGKQKFGFEQAAIEALRRWQFKPGKLNAKPVDILMNLRMTFEIQ